MMCANNQEKDKSFSILCLGIQTQHYLICTADREKKASVCIKVPLWIKTVFHIPTQNKKLTLQPLLKALGPNPETFWSKLTAWRRVRWVKALPIQPKQQVLFLQHDYQPKKCRMWCDASAHCCPNTHLMHHPPCVCITTCNRRNAIHNDTHILRSALFNIAILSRNIHQRAQKHLG